MAGPLVIHTSLEDIARDMHGTVQDAMAAWQRCVDKGIFVYLPLKECFTYGPNYGKP
jgi:hypothetical protein